MDSVDLQNPQPWSQGQLATPSGGASNRIPPELLEQLLASGSLDAKNKALEEQLAQALALAKPNAAPETQKNGALANVLNVASNLINQHTSQSRTAALRDQQTANQGQQTASNKALIEAYLKQQALGNPQQQPQPAVQPIPDFPEGQ